MNDGLRRAAGVLAGADSVALACHVNPDADALGSMLGLAVFLRGRGTEVACSFGNEPFEAPRWVTAFPGNEMLVEPRLIPKEPDVMVALDCASEDRLAMLAPNAAKAKTLIWIDHHVGNDGFGTISLVDPKASSSAEIVYRLVKEMGGPMPPDTAVCLYAGLVTDTGRFQYAAVTPEVLRIAAELREQPFDHARLVQALYDDNRLAYLRLLGLVLGRVEHIERANLVWTHIRRTDLAGAGVKPAETDDVIDILRTAREADVAAVIKEQRDGRFKVSMRSRGDRDLAAVAAKFGGGGHRLAAGYTSGHGLAETVERLAGALEESAGPT